MKHFLFKTTILCLCSLFFFNHVTANEAVNLYQQRYLEKEQKTPLETNAFEQLKMNLSKVKAVEPITPLALSPFHFQSSNKVTPILEQSAKTTFCVGCHSTKAHKKSAKVRSFLNMHTKTIGCQTCHFPQKSQTLSYQWQNASGDLVKSIDLAHKSEYLLVPTYQGVAINTHIDSGFGKKIIDLWQKNQKHLHQDQYLTKQALLWQNIHQGLELFNKNPQTRQIKKCSHCHQQTAPKLDLAKLGADKQRQQAFEQNIIARFFSRYAKDDERINLIELLN